MPLTPDRMASRKGFTLFEVLLTIILVSSGSVVLLSALGQGLFASGDNQSSLEAIALAQEKMEELRNKSYTEIVSESRLPVSGFPDFQRQVTVTTPQSGLKQIEVSVHWFVKAGELSQALTSYVSQI